MSETATFTYEARDGVKAIFLHESEAFRTFARDTEELPIYDATGEMIGTFVPASPDAWDDATGTPEEDAEDIRRARAAMEDIRENGSIPWEQVKAELGL